MLIYEQLYSSVLYEPRHVSEMHWLITWSVRNRFLPAPASSAAQQDPPTSTSKDNSEANICWLGDCPVKKEAFFSKDKAVTIHFPKYFQVYNVYLVQARSI